MNEREYQIRETDLLWAQIARIEKAPLSDRREARADYLAALNVPGLIAERVAWLIAGHYGYGAALTAARTLKAHASTNKVARLAHLVAALDHNCPANFATKAYYNLSAERQAAVNAEIQAEIDGAEPSVEPVS